MATKTETRTTLRQFRPSNFGASAWYHASYVNLVTNNVWRTRLYEAEMANDAADGYDMRAHYEGSQS
jgi:hypothetical protein